MPVAGPLAGVLQGSQQVFAPRSSQQVRQTLLKQQQNRAMEKRQRQQAQERQRMMQIHQQQMLQQQTQQQQQQQQASPQFAQRFPQQVGVVVLIIPGKRGVCFRCFSISVLSWYLDVCRRVCLCVLVSLPVSLYLFFLYFCWHLIQSLSRFTPTPPTTTILCSLSFPLIDCSTVPNFIAFLKQKAVMVLAERDLYNN